MLKDELVELKKDLLQVSYISTDMIKLVLEGIKEKSFDKLTKVIEELEPQVNENEVKIERHCVQVLGLFQPTATDLREVIMIIKINNELERIADLAVKCATNGLKLINDGHLLKKIQLHAMGENVITMLIDVLNSFINSDISLAKRTVENDDNVDTLRDQNFQYLLKIMAKDSKNISLYMNMLTISKSLERIADHITHIAEDIIYILSAESIRHQ